MKPHIFLAYEGIWACQSKDKVLTGMGCSPEKAYNDWVILNVIREGESK